MNPETLLSALARATRFFARPLSFDLECPRCGDVYQIRLGQLRGRGRKEGSHHPNWDPLTSRFQCTNKGCGRVYVIGLVAWSITGAGSASQPPEDAVPGPRQLAQMRREGGGWWMEEGQRFRRPHTTNLTTEEDRPVQEDE